MQFAWDVLNLGNFIIALIGIIFFYGIVFYAAFKVMKRKSAFIALGISFFFVLISFLLNLFSLLVVTAIFSIVVFTAYVISNLGDLRAFISNPFRKTAAKGANFGVEKIYSRENLYKQLESTVLNLSRTRVGAIITFEKNISLKDIMKNGVPVHAPVSQELLSTIFYPGTRLHDGAVVIHGNEIVAASVFFTPTTKPFAEKYGSRHRAAIGVSEVTDAVTVVVSEETGRISLAVNGELESVEPANFLRAFETYMADNSDQEN